MVFFVLKMFIFQYKKIQIYAFNLLKDNFYFVIKLEITSFPKKQTTVKIGVIYFLITAWFL